MNPTIKKVMLTTDLSQASWKALRPAVGLAEAFDAELVIFFGLPPVNAALGTFDLAVMPVDLAEVRGRRTEEAKEKIKAKLKEYDIKRPVEIVVTETKKPTEEIVNQTKALAADVLVLATHGRTGLAHVLYGSTAEEIVRKSPVSVLSIRAFPPAQKERQKTKNSDDAKLKA